MRSIQPRLILGDPPLCHPASWVSWVCVSHTGQAYPASRIPYWPRIDYCSKQRLLLRLCCVWAPMRTIHISPILQLVSMLLGLLPNTNPNLTQACIVVSGIAGGRRHLHRNLHCPNSPTARHLQPRNRLEGYSWGQGFCAKVMLERTSNLTPNRSPNPSP